jgi:hypothetical protein
MDAVPYPSTDDQSRFPHAPSQRARVERLLNARSVGTCLQISCWCRFEKEGAAAPSRCCVEGPLPHVDGPGTFHRPVVPRGEFREHRKGKQNGSSFVM